MEAIRSKEGRIGSPCRGIWVKTRQCRHHLHTKVGPPVLGGQVAQLRGVVVSQLDFLGYIFPGDTRTTQGENQAASPAWVDHVVQLAGHEGLSEDDEGAGHRAQLAQHRVHVASPARCGCISKVLRTWVGLTGSGADVISSKLDGDQLPLGLPLGLLLDGCHQLVSLVGRRVCPSS